MGCAFPTEDAGALQAFFAQLGVQRVVVQQALHGDGHFFWVPWIDEQCGVADDFGQAADIADNGRCATSHGF